MASADARFTISTHSEKSPPDHFAFFKGSQNEQICLLYAGASRQLLAAEYLVDGSPVYYLGPKIDCRTVAITATGRGIDDAELIARKNKLAEFFRGHPVSGPSTEPTQQPSLSADGADLRLPTTTSPPVLPSVKKLANRLLTIRTNLILYNQI